MQLRREKIAERMKNLQELVPNASKVIIVISSKLYSRFSNSVGLTQLYINLNRSMRSSCYMNMDKASYFILNKLPLLCHTES